jgi:uncharacterized protein YecE (DUF72 family)
MAAAGRCFRKGGAALVSIRVGIGSWSDDAYRGVLYPPKLPAAGRLRAYAQIFDHVEVNSTYYGAPKPEAVKKWIAETPPGFLFDIKLHRVFSMSPRSAQPVEGKRDLLGYTLERLEPLVEARKLGVFLLLLTARFGPDKHSLAELDTLVRRLMPFSLAVELRDPAWVAGKARATTLAAFRDAGIALVDVDMPRGPEFFPILDEVTNPQLAYLRLHGRNRAGYLKGGSAADQHHYKYNAAELGELAARIKKIAKKASNVRVVCNNHAEDFAPQAALALRGLLGPTRKKAAPVA